YSPDLYKSETIERMMEHFMQLLSSIIKEPFQKVGKLSMLTQAEERQMLIEFNDTAVPYSRDKTVVELFEQQAAKTPDAIAVFFEEEQLTYHELNQRANQLAYLLKSKGVKEDTLVPLCLERSHQMIVGMLGILKAGGAYVPIDPQYPVDRIKYMVMDSQAAVIVGSPETKSTLKTETQLDIIELESKWSAIHNQPVNNVHTHPQADQLAYMIYTSGSTGRPKGAAVRHQNLLNLLQWYISEFSITGEDKNIIISSFAFDLTQKNIFSTLITGGTLILPAMRYYDNESVVKHIRQKAVTIINCAPNAFYPLVADNTSLSDLNSLRLVVLGGEPIHLKHLENWILRDDYQCEIVNSYGPTECTDIAAFFRMKNPKDYINKTIPIGCPNDNVKLFVLNKSDQLQPVGVAGEICIAGDGVGAGYLNDKELTARKFIVDPFSSDGESRLYKTGDLGRWLSDGNIEYLGRKDEQIKIRGYRIEPGEIEGVIRESGLVKEALVLAKKDSTGNDLLIGYIVTDEAINKEAIKNYLKDRLPEYMIPAIWVELESLPQTPNGKIDKNALPELDNSKILNAGYIAPRNEAESMLAKIWEDVLNIEKVGINNNFFELGGYSLIILKLVSKVRKLGLKIEVKDFSKYQTIEQQSNFISTSLKLFNAAGEGRFVIPIQSEGNNIPLFAIPEFLLYSPIGQGITKQQPFYTIERSPFDDIKEVVNHYISEIKKVCPHGPYILAGYCNWGDITVELAKTLIAQGEEVPVLIFIEYYSPSIKMPRVSIKFMHNKFKFIKNKLRNSISFADKGKFLYEELKYGLKYFKEQITGSGLKKSESTNKTYTGKVILFQASETYGFKNDSHMGWKNIFTGEVNKYIIKGEHLDIMNGSSAAQIAEILNEELKPAPLKE
ncbi:MAG TPA: amino acid adenylation domain-containing protein, partial [Chitinophagaceae bacterium]|nr:amino acid adenylation domain-containing protein [Chitinophagaceae bacterium]